MRESAPLLPSSWPRPAAVDLIAGDGVEVSWDGSGGSTEVHDPRALADLLDRFVLAGRPDGRPDGEARRAAKFMALADTFGPWGACVCGKVHAELSRGMDPYGPIPTPPGRRRVLPRPNHQPIGATVRTSHRINVLRALIATSRLADVTEPRVIEAALERWSATEPARLVPEAAAAGRVAREILDRWLLSCHVVPSSGWLREGSAPIILNVGGLAGALAVAVLAEASSRPRTGVCERCGTTWTVWREWDASLAGGLGRCRTCQSQERGTRYRATERGRKEGS
jgi:hypothetical protein